MIRAFVRSVPFSPKIGGGGLDLISPTKHPSPVSLVMVDPGPNLELT